MTADDDAPIISDDELGPFLLATEAWLEDRGWGNNPLVLTLQIDDGDEADNPGYATDDDEDDLVFGVVGEGDPLAILDGLDASEEIALVVATEQGGVRTVVVGTSDGQALTVTRARGEDPVVHGGGDDAIVAAIDAALYPPED